MTVITIGIIGGGPSGISLCMQLKNALIQYSLHQNVKIIVFEKKTRPGVGLPYDNKDPCYRINLNKNMMEPMPEATGQFSKWIDSCHDLIKNTDFPPRFYFGCYLESIALQMQQEVQNVGPNIIFLTEHDVFDIKPLDNNRFEVHSYNKNTHCRHSVDHIILSLGHLPASSFSHFIGKPGYQHNPWEPNAFEAIPPNKIICIIGSKLTAIDVALKLKQMNHQGKIYMVSPSGLLPTIKGNTSTYKLVYLMPQNIRKLMEKNTCPLKLMTIMSLLEQELKQCLGPLFNMDKFINQSTTFNPIKRINYEIYQIETADTPWQKILSVFYQYISRLWPLLSIDDKLLFQAKYNRIFMTYLCSLPLESGYKIQKMLVNGHLHVMNNFSIIDYENSNYCIRFTSGTPFFAEHVINATGSGNNLTQVPLLKNLLTRGFVTKHQLGGICVCPNTLNVMDRNEQINPRLYAMGDLVKGTCFAIVEMRRIVEQSSLIIKDIIKRMSRA